VRRVRDCRATDPAELALVNAGQTPAGRHTVAPQLERSAAVFSGRRLDGHFLALAVLALGLRDIERVGPVVDDAVEQALYALLLKAEPGMTPVNLERTVALRMPTMSSLARWRGPLRYFSAITSSLSATDFEGASRYFFAAAAKFAGISKSSG